MLKRRICFVVICTVLLAINILPANATVIDWTLQNVVFNDGGTATGTFSTDSTTGDVLDFNITTTSGTKLSGTIYDGTVAQVFNNRWAPDSFDLTDEGAHVYLELAFSSPLTQPGADPFASGSPSYECNNCSPARIAVSGEAVSASSVPEPATLPLLSMGLLGLSAVRPGRPLRCGRIVTAMACVRRFSRGDVSPTRRSFRHYLRR